jgi:thymidylate kinase
MHGLFLALDGVDGAGKSTQAARLHRRAGEGAAAAWPVSVQNGR